jgi:hypothetical protein
LFILPKKNNKKKSSETTIERGAVRLHCIWIECKSVRKSVSKEWQNHECNSRALRATRQSDLCWHSEASANQQFVTSPRDSTDIANRGKQQWFIFSVHFLFPPSSVSFSPAYILVSFFSPSSPLFSYTVFIHSSFYLSTGRKETDTKMKLQTWVFALKQLLTLFHPEE